MYLATAVCPLGSHHSRSVLQRNVSTISPASHVQTQGAGEMAGPFVPEINGTCSRKEPSFLLPASVCSMCSHCPLLVPCCREAAWLKFWRQVWIVPLYYRQSTGWDHRQPARIVTSPCLRGPSSKPDSSNWSKTRLLLFSFVSVILLSRRHLGWCCCPGCSSYWCWGLNRLHFLKLGTGST